MKSATIWLSASLILVNCPYPVAAYDANSPLTKTQQSLAKRGNSYAGSNKAEKAQTTYQSAIDQATSLEQCLALIKGTEHFGSILSPVRRLCLTKALSLAKTDDDYFQIILAARQCQFYEVTKQCVDALIARAKTKDQLLNLAHKSQSMAVNDVAHIAMEKLYASIDNAADKLTFAKEAKLMAMEDLMRQAIKEILDQEQTAHGLCLLITAVEPLEVPDLQRKIVRKAVYQVNSVDDCKEVYEVARRLGQQDIVNLAAFKGRKMILMQQSNAEQQAIKDQQEALKQAQELKEAEENGLPPPTKPESKSAEGQDNKTKAPVGPGF